MITKTLTVTPYIIREPLFVVRDAPRKAAEVNENVSRQIPAASVLERYYDDVFKLLLAKLVDFDRVSAPAVDEGKKLQALVAELVKVRSQLEAGSSLV